MKNKLNFVSKLLQMQRILREENENIIWIKAINNNVLPNGILLEGKEAVTAFMEAKNLDSINEKRPYWLIIFGIL